MRDRCTGSVLVTDEIKALIGIFTATDAVRRVLAPRKDPASVTLHEDQTEQFSAAGFDQFADPMELSPNFTWAVLSGDGAVDATGLYTAPAATGSETIRASSGSISGTATVTVSNAAPTIAGNRIARYQQPRIAKTSRSCALRPVRRAIDRGAAFCPMETV